jgi:hypothetical protein
MMKMMKKNKKHPGFKAMSKEMAQKEGMPMMNASSMLASSSRKASPIAKKKNPRLKKVKG